jgi:deoxyadenosine/deoxycytidine kinase
MIVSFDGLPGSGKTSLIQSVASRLPATTWLEDVEAFPLVHHGNAAAPELVFLNQADFLVRKLGEASLMASRPGLQLVEMDWIACHVVWAPAMARAGRISPTQARCLDAMYEAGIRADLRRPDLTFFLTVPPEVALARMARRGRAFEADFERLVRELADGDIEAVADALDGELLVLDGELPPDELTRHVVDTIHQRGMGSRGH